MKTVKYAATAVIASVNGKTATADATVKCPGSIWGTPESWKVGADIGAKKGEPMSILVKNMEMPSECEYCGFCRYYLENGNVWCNATNRLLKQHWKEPNLTHLDVKRPDWCPLKEQPEEDCDSCKHGYFGSRQCDNCRVRYPSHYERRTDE